MAQARGASARARAGAGGVAPMRLPEVADMTAYAKSAGKYERFFGKRVAEEGLEFGEAVLWRLPRGGR